MATADAVIYQTEYAPDKVFKWNGAAFSDQTTEALTIGGTAQTMWEDANDVMYFGRSTVAASGTTPGWVYLGIKIATPAVGYGTFTIEYSADYTITIVNQGTKTFSIAENIPTAFIAGDKFRIEGSTGNDGQYTVVSASWGATTDIIVTEAIPSAVADGAIHWIELVVLHNSVSGFTQDGFFMWQLPGAWSLLEVNSTTRYWIRALQTSGAPGTPATYYCVYENVTLYAPIVMRPNDSRETVIHDTNQVTRKTDIPSTAPTELTISGTVITLGLSGANLNLLFHFKKDRLECVVYDLNYSATPTISTDSFYKTYTGRWDRISPEIWALSKQGMDDAWEMRMFVSAVDSLTSLAGG